MTDEEKSKEQLIAELVELRRDITEHKQVEEDLRFEHTRLLDILDAIPDGVYVVSRQGDIEYINPVIEREFGPVKGRKCYDYFHDRQEFCPWCKNAEVFAGESVEWEWYSFKNERHYSLFDTPFINADGSVSKFEIFHDITERKQMEKDKAKLEGQLYQSQKMEAIGLLAGGVAHDFNNTLTIIIINVALVLNDQACGDTLREPLERIATAAKGAADLTQQLLAFSRKQVILPKVINLNHLIEDLHRTLVRLIGEDIIVRTVPQRRLGRVRVDPGQIEQIVFNLAVNARDAMPNGGELFIETADIVLDEKYCNTHANAKPGAYVMLAVSDTGCGMDVKMRSKIFEPFFTTKELGRGTGLGLATVLGIVEQSGGRIEVYSEPGKGSSFKIYFPSVADKVEPHTHSDVPDPVGGQETVLVVEDNEMVRTMAVEILRRLGYQVLVAASSPDALLLAERHEGPIDLLLTDVIMPHMNGRQLASKFAELRPGIKVLYTSGYTQNVIAHHGVLDEGVQFLGKPYSIDGLAIRVRKVLDDAGLSGSPVSECPSWKRNR